ncbi:hypothetical protein [Bacillus sp. TL12]|uniref:hypothetical protein n=1 Tax=Bacillus sp. TL12 TaxID=2894756 RepID=UPI001F521A9C|nr:hypothetical protein [Bacillus sp. TL12]MCI0768190.1 hypothetical protein [Bacillus sp. TL12]
MNSLKPLFFILTKPKVTLINIFNKKNILITVLLICFINAILSLILTIELFNQTTLIKELNLNTSINNFLKIFTYLIAFFSSFINPLINTVITTIIILITYYIFKIKIEFKQLFIIGLLAYIPYLIDISLRIIVQFFYNEIITGHITSIFFFMTQNKNPMINALKFYSIASIWSIVIYIIGLTILVKKEKQTIAITIVILLLLIITYSQGVINLKTIF